MHRFVREFGHFAVNLEFSPDGKLLGADSSDGVTVWDVAEGRKGHQNGELIVWNAMSWREVRAVKAHLGEILSITVSPQSDRLATTSRDGTTLISSIDRPIRQ
jgi:WD40 repeat protein